MATAMYFAFVIVQLCLMGASTQADLCSVALAPVVEYAIVAPSPSRVLWPNVGEISGEGAPDVMFVLSVSGMSTIRWIRNSGAGVFSTDPLQQRAVGAPLPYNVVALVLARIDADVFADALVAGNDTVLWYRNNGTGGFTDAPQVITSSLPGLVGAACVDVNVDGHTDVVVASASTLVWFASNGSEFDGGAAHLIVSPCSCTVLILVVADLTGDGVPDVLVGLGNSPSPIVFFANNGTGGFSSLARDVTQAGALSDSRRLLTAADLSGDGLADVLAEGSSFGRSVVWFVNLGGGVFRPDAIVIVDKLGSIVRALATADLTADGAADVLFSTASVNGRVSWLANNGSGGFPQGVQQISQSTSDVLAFLAFGDLDGNGLIDPVVALSLAGRIDWYANSRAVNWASPATLISADLFFPRSVAAADVTNDGRVDVITADSSSLAIFLNDGAGAFPAGKQTIANTAQLRFVLVVDVDSDGSLDIVTAASYESISWYRNLGTGKFSPNKQVAWTYLPDVECLGAADLSNDTVVDLVGCVGSELFVLINNGTGGFGPRRVIASIVANDVAFGDVNGDTSVDLLVAAGSLGSPAMPRAILLALNDGTGAFPDGVRVLFSTGLQMKQVVFASVNGDAQADVIYADQFAIAWFALNATALPMLPVTTISASSFTDSLFAADLNNDGALDLLATQANTVSAYLNSGVGVFSSVTLASSIAQAQAAVAADLNNDGVADVIYTAPSVNQLWWLRTGISMATPLRSPNVLAQSQARWALPAECAGLSETIACQAARITAHSTPCAPARLALPARVRGCMLEPLRLQNSGPSASLALTGVAESTAGTLVQCATPDRQSLFELTPGVVLALTNVTIVGPPAGMPRSAGRSLFSLCSASCTETSAPTWLSLVNVSVSGFTNTPQASGLARDLDRGFGVLALYTRAALSARACVFFNNSGSVGGVVAALGDSARVLLIGSTCLGNLAVGSAKDSLAFGGGGAIALIGTAQTLTLVNCTLESNRAIADSGGAVLVRSPGARVQLIDTHVRGNWAELAGGGVALAAANGAELSLRQTHLDGNSAGAYGGSVAAFSKLLLDVASALDASAMALMPHVDGASLGGGSVVFDSGCTLGDTRARYGGAFFACAARINATSLAILRAPQTPNGGGGLGFACNALASSTSLADLAWLLLPPVSSSSGQLPPPLVAPADGAARYGPIVASPPLSLVQLDALPSSIQSGQRLGAGVFVARDAFGQRVVASELVLRLGLAASAAASQLGASTIGTDAVVLASTLDASYSIALVAPSARGWPALLAPSGAMLDFELSIDAGGVPSAVPGSPVLDLSVLLTNCQAGWGRVSGDGLASPLVCAPCTGGTFSTGERAGLGEPCDVCPPNTVQLAASVDGGTNATTDQLTDCVCKAGFYSPNGLANTACQVCPPGGVCDGALAAPLAAPGFSSQDGVFVTCPIAGACLGGDACARGYAGRLCGQCARGWYTLNGRCRPCNSAQTGLVALVLALLALLVIAALLWFNAASGAGGESRFVAAAIGLAALQVIALFGKLAIDWGPVASGFFQVASVLSLNFQLASPECSLARGIDSWVLKWALMLALPGFAALAIGALALMLLWPLRRAGVQQLSDLTIASLADACGRTWYQVLVLMHLPLTAAALSPFGCRRDESGVWILVDDPSRVCFDARWWRLFAPALLCSLLYGIVLPAAVGLALARARARLDPVAFVLRYGFLVARYVPHCYGAEAAAMGFKVALVLVSTFFASAESKVGAGALVIGFAAIATSHARPFARWRHNVLALGCMTAILAALVAGTLDARVLRRVVATGAVVVLIVAVLAGNAIDLWATWRSRLTGERSWKESTATRHARDAELDEASSRGGFTRTGGLVLEILGDGEMQATVRQAESAERSFSLDFDHSNMGSAPVPLPPPLPEQQQQQ